MAFSILLVWSSYAVQKRSAAIEGVVIDGGTEQPIAGVQVFVSGSQPIIQAITDVNGRFALNELESGRYQIQTKRQGFGPLRSGNKNGLGEPGIWLSLTPGRWLNEIVLRLFPLGAITGRVFDQQGRPVIGSYVIPSRFTYDDDGERYLKGIPGRAPAKTDDRGQFRIFDLPHGEYLISVEQPLSMLLGSEEAFGSAFYPGTADASKAVVVRVGPGEEIRLGDITVMSFRRPTVRLRVVNMTDATPPSTRILTFRYGTLGVADLATRTAALGGPDRLEIRSLPPGVYDFGLSWETTMGKAFGRAMVEVRDSDIEAEIVVRRPVRLAVSVVAEQPDGSRRSLEGVQCILRLKGLGTRFDASSRGDGMFVIENLPQGDYQIQFAGLDPDTYIASVREGERNVLEEGLRIEHEMSINVLIKAMGGYVEGTVTNNDRAVPGAVVALIPDAAIGPADQRYRSATTDQNGGFLIRGIAPGSYHLYAWPELPGPAYKNLDFISQYRDRGTGIRVANGEKVITNLDLLEENSR